ncbi:hypothetical protein OY671_008096, partial [Metschnikowia pulcherrima]
HTGKGKGKTSAASGMVVRAIGHGMKVGVVQFVKGAMQTGEARVFAAFPDNVEFKPMGEGFTWDTQDRARDIAAARRAWDEVQRMIADPAYHMVSADEMNIALRYEYSPLDEVSAVLAAKPERKHVIVTGRNAHEALIEAADLVTEMTMVKHPFRSGFNELSRWRRDVRHFAPRGVKEMDMRASLECAALAPSVGNSQPWRFVRSRSPSIRDTLAMHVDEQSARAAERYAEQARHDHYSSSKSHASREAPELMAVFCDDRPEAGHGLGTATMPETSRYSCVSAIHNSWSAARLRGIGLGWVSI